VVLRADDAQAGRRHGGLLSPGLLLPALPAVAGDVQPRVPTPPLVHPVVGPVKVIGPGVGALSGLAARQTGPIANPAQS
jgi:hypothetical protein